MRRWPANEASRYCLIDVSVWDNERSSAMAKITGAEITARALRHLGVDTIFYIIGGPTTPVAEAAFATRPETMTASSSSVSPTAEIPNAPRCLAWF